MLIRVRENCLNSQFQLCILEIRTVLRHDKIRSQTYNTRGTSTSTVKKPKTEVQWPVNRRTKTSRIVGEGGMVGGAREGGRGCAVAFYIF
jgi:hypothetical protein